MILKYSNDGKNWYLIDKIDSVFINNEPVVEMDSEIDYTVTLLGKFENCIEIRKEFSHLHSFVYLLNDEGKTIERL